MKPIRILQVMASLDRGGAETMIVDLYRNIDRSIIQFDFVVNERSLTYDYEEEIKELGGRIFRMPWYCLSNLITYKKKWRLLLEEHEEWKIIHGHHTSPAFIYLKVANSLNRITVAHSHISGGEKSLKSLVKRLQRFPLRFVAQYRLACSHDAAQWMFGNNTNAIVLKNAINTAKFVFNSDVRYQVRESLDIDKEFIIGHVGRFQTQKNHKFIIEIFDQIVKRNNDVVLLLIGEGELKDEIKMKVDLLGLKDKVIFAGVREDVPNLLFAMDAFLFPSLYEGLGIVAIEAQAAGLKTIISDEVPSEAHITNLVTSLSLSKSAEEWANVILDLCNDDTRDSPIDTIKGAGYDINITSAWLQNFYKELMY